ncbi:hypothetical protein [Paraburkholderia sp. CI3]|uniref:hypothetical protein n=1 Tax=Paraburkholderia sp. CI3 TaxID=2991060 RepID=UPI003D1EE39D
MALANFETQRAGLNGDGDVFNESQDRDYADWKRIRLVIEHENTLVHHRLSWLLTSQTVLFAALAFIVSNWKPQPNIWTGPYVWLLILIAVLGFMTSLLVGRGLGHAQQHIARIDRWWYCEDRSKLSMEMLDEDMFPGGASRVELTRHRLPFHPPLQGQTKKRVDEKFINPYNLPYYFMGAWAVIVAIMLIFRP